ncbi:MAG: universal stress protein [Pseudomonadota bacterium]
MYKNILVPVSFEGTCDATDAIDLATTLLVPDGDITILHVIEQVPAYVASYIPAEFAEETQKSLKSKLDKLASSRTNTNGVLISGHSARSILDFAEANEHDLIVVSSHRPGMQDLLLGSTAAKIVRHATCSVHVVR